MLTLRGTRITLVVLLLILLGSSLLVAPPARAGAQNSSPVNSSWSCTGTLSACEAQGPR